MLRHDHFGKEDELSLEEQGGTIDERIDKLIALSGMDDDSFNLVNFNAGVQHVVEKKDSDKAEGLYKLLKGDMKKVLEKAIKSGPLEDGEVTSKEARDELVSMNLMAHITTGSEKDDGGKACAATYHAYEFWKMAKGDDADDDDSDDDDKDQKYKDL